MHLLSDPAHTSSLNSGAKAALAGYDYQLDVSILAALRILFVTKSATRITLEPANTEDIEIELEDDDPGHVSAQAELGAATRLIIQVKLRSGDPWSIAAIKSLLEHGKRRAPAKNHLLDLNTRYLLVTNSDVSRGAKNLVVKDFEEHPERKGFPAKLREILPKQPDGRIAIYASLTPKLLKYEIDHIMTDFLRVPKDRQKACLSRLREEAQARMRGSVPGVWSYIDLIETINNHGGFLASIAELDTFVEPSNFQDMIRQLERKHAVVITGSSGTGKTLAALALCDYARKRNGALDLKIVGSSSDPASIRQAIQSGPKLFYIEDPWGQYSLLAGSEMWTEQLPRILRNANSENRYLVTSRSDMLLGAQATEEFKAWSIELEADSYINGKLAEIYEKRMYRLPPELQMDALKFKSDVLSSLEKPLELDLFFSCMMSGRDEGENDRQWLRRLIGLAHRDAVEGVVDRFLTQTDQIGQSAVILGLLAARGAFNHTQLIAIMRALRKVTPNLSDGLVKLVDRLVSARHLRQPHSTIAFAHPSVRAGFEEHLKSDWYRFEPLFSSLLVALTTLPEPHLEWGMETAARLIQEGQRLIGKIESCAYTFEVPAAAQIAIDGWLNAALIDPAGDFSKLLQLASDVGSEASIPSELSRWLLTRARRRWGLFLEDWKAPNHSNTWYKRVSGDPSSFLIAERFVRELLANDRGSYGAGFPKELDRIAPGLEHAYLDAANRLVGTGYGSSIGAVITGAMRNWTAFKLVVEKALDDLQSDDAQAEKNAEQRRRIDDGECDYSFEEYYSFGHEDDGYASASIIELFVKAARAAGNWKELAEHSRASEIVGDWARAILIAAPEAAPSTEEMSAMLAVALAHGNEGSAWDAIGNHWDPTFRENLKQALSVGTQKEDRNLSAVACAIKVDSTLLKEVFDSFATPVSRVTFLCDLVGVRNNPTSNQTTAISLFIKTIAPAYREIGLALLKQSKRTVSLGSEAILLLRQAAESAQPRTLSKIVPYLIKAGKAPAEPVRRWLNETRDKALAEEAASAAVKIQDAEAIITAFEHPRASARKVALRFLAGRSDPPFPFEILSLANDPSRYVREELVRILSEKFHPDHFQTLLGLTSDTYSDADPTHNEAESYPIARMAVEALAAYAPLSDKVCDQLITLAKSTPDRELSKTSLKIVANAGSAATRKQILLLCDERDLGWLRLDALNALVFADKLEDNLITPFTSESIVQLGPAMAPSAIALVCCHAPLETAVALCEQMAQSNTNRSLAILGSYVLYDRDSAAAEAILDLMPEGHPIRGLFQDQGVPLPSSVLDGLGDVKRQQWVLNWMSDRIQMRP